MAKIRYNMLNIKPSFRTEDSKKMKNGFVKVAAVTPKIRVADTTYNAQMIREHMAETVRNGAKVVVFPELCITGYSCGDLFLQEKLLEGAKDELVKIATYSRTLDAIFFVGLPYEINGKLYNVAAVISRGDVLALVPKSYLPNYNEFTANSCFLKCIPSGFRYAETGN